VPEVMLKSGYVPLVGIVAAAVDAADAPVVLAVEAAAATAAGAELATPVAPAASEREFEKCRTVCGTRRKDCRDIDKLLGLTAGNRARARCRARSSPPEMLRIFD
jgi:hypothetical protein